jgi:hypothetical protein
MMRGATAPQHDFAVGGGIWPASERLSQVLDLPITVTEEPGSARVRTIWLSSSHETMNFTDCSDITGYYRAATNLKENEKIPAELPPNSYLHLYGARYVRHGVSQRPYAPGALKKPRASEL